MRVRHAGEGALLVETGDTALAHRLHEHLRRERLAGIRELVPGLSTLLIVADPLVADLEVLAAAIPRWQLPPESADRAHEVVVEVRYDGPDLDAVATLTGLSREAVISRHLEACYRVAFLGFVPGFAYLTGLPPELEVPRLETPRTRVPAGAVAIAGGMSVIYPQATPGGWRLIGHTDIRLFDAGRRPPNRLAPGDRVRFSRRA